MPEKHWYHAEIVPRRIDPNPRCRELQEWPDVSPSVGTQFAAFSAMTWRERAQALVEYGLIIVLVGVLAIADLMIYGPAVGRLLNRLDGSV